MVDARRLCNEIVLYKGEDSLFKFEPHQEEMAFNLAIGFAERLYSPGQSAEYYTSMRSARDPKKDILVSKIAEIASALWFRKHGFSLPSVDFGIRTPEMKGWSSDLKFSGHELPDTHVKSCTNATVDYVGTPSWTFQYANDAGPGGRDALFTDTQSMDLVVLTQVISYGLVAVLATGPWRMLYPMLRDPKSPSLQGLKKCIYFYDLQLSLSDNV